jgi:hypothetical protein
MSTSAPQASMGIFRKRQKNLPPPAQAGDGRAFPRQFSLGSFTLKEVRDEGNHREQQQDVNQRARHMKQKKAAGPTDQQDHE